MLDDLGLLPALRSCLSAFAARTGLHVRLRASPLAEKLSKEQKLVVFRVAQECLTNVAKHAQAKRVNVELRRLKNAISVQIADDGKSFREDSLNSARDHQRLGLLGMRERVRLVNGEFTVNPQPGKGTTIRVVLPCRLARGPLDPKGRRK
jgi:signal transduction histidine kinase